MVYRTATEIQKQNNKRKERWDGKWYSQTQKTKKKITLTDCILAKKTRATYKKGNLSYVCTWLERERNEL